MRLWRERSGAESQWTQGHGDDASVYSKDDRQSHLLHVCLVTSNSKDPSSREQVRDPAPRSHGLFLAASSSLSAKRERKTPLLPAGLLTRPKAWLRESKKPEDCLGFGVGEQDTGCPEKGGPSPGQPMKSAYHPECRRSKSPHQNVEEKSPEKSDVLMLPGHQMEFNQSATWRVRPCREIHTGSRSSQRGQWFNSERFNWWLAWADNWARALGLWGEQNKIPSPKELPI